METTERPPRHYYGDVVRILFVVAAALGIVNHFVGSAFLTTPASLVAAALLVVAAGLTNPVQRWIHGVNVLLSLGGFIICGYVSFSHYQSGESMAAEAIVIALTGVFLVALYLSVRTLRGVLLRGVNV